MILLEFSCVTFGHDKLWGDIWTQLMRPESHWSIGLARALVPATTMCVTPAPTLTAALQPSATDPASACQRQAGSPALPSLSASPMRARCTPSRSWLGTPRPRRVLANACLDFSESVRRPPTPQMPRRADVVVDPCRTYQGSSMVSGHCPCRQLSYA